MANPSGNMDSSDNTISLDDRLQSMLQQESAYLCPKDYMKEEREIQLKLERASSSSSTSSSTASTTTLSKVLSDASLRDVTKTIDSNSSHPQHPTSHRRHLSSMQFWREQMFDWSCMVVDSLGADREVVAVSFNLLDRYVVSELARPSALPISRDDYQLFSMTCLYLAIKVWEPFPRKLSVDTLVDMSQQYYSRAVVEQTEREILTALQWRLHPPTSLGFARLYAEQYIVQSSSQSSAQLLLQTTLRTITEVSLVDTRCLCDRPSHVGRAAVILAAQQLGLTADRGLVDDDAATSPAFVQVYTRLQRLYWE